MSTVVVVFSFHRAMAYVLTHLFVAPCGSGLSGFSQESQRSVISYLGKQSCLHKNAVRSRPTPAPVIYAPPINYQTPTPAPVIYAPPINYQGPFQGGLNYTGGTRSGVSASFEIRSNAISSHCMTFENNAVVLSKCDRSRSQEWAFNRDRKYLSNIAEGRCLVPNTGDKTTKKVRLTLRPCPDVIDKSFQWNFSNNKIRNKRRTSSGSTQVIEAIRAIKNVNGDKSVVIVPTLSILDANKGDYQKWSRAYK